MPHSRFARARSSGRNLWAGRVSQDTYLRAQVPDWVPLSKDDTVVYSGFAEIALGAGLILAAEEHQQAMGNIAALFFAAVFPGNVSQYLSRRDAFGLDTDEKRLAQLFFQPAFIYWALKSSER